MSEAVEPNQVWAIDFKGHFRTGDGQRCDPLTISDTASRYLLRCQAVERTGLEYVRPLLEATMREYGMPLAIRSDNGPPFGSVGLGGLSRLGVWLVHLGVLPERIDPGHPEQNGRHERLHRTLKRETAKPPQPTGRAQQAAFDAFRKRYNQERPHEALEMNTPASVYVPSPRIFPARLPDIEYPGHYQLRRVQIHGDIGFASTPVAVDGLGDVVAIAAGEEHTCALLGIGTATRWGDGTATPAAVNGLHGAIGLAAGWYHNCAALADGTARCWGEASEGQSGDGTARYYTAPQTVIGTDAIFSSGFGLNLLAAGLPFALVIGLAMIVHGPSPKPVANEGAIDGDAD